MPSSVLRVLIVDDERAARANLRRLLDTLDPPVVVEESPDGRGAIARLRAGGIDLVLLDVQMPETNGFDVIHEIGVDAMPPVVFTTAHDEHALEAFAMFAIGYLLKPVSRDRLAHLVSRVRTLRETSAQSGPEGGPASAPLAAQVAALRGVIAGAGPARYLTRLAVREEDRTFHVATTDIIWIEAKNVHVRLHTTGGVHDLRQPLTELQERLSPDEFARVHRGAMIRIDRIREIQPWFNGEHVIILRNNDRVVTGRSYRDTVRRLLGHH